MTGQVSALARAIIDRVYPVHIIVDFSAEVDPNSAIGCGTTWTRIADGRALIASDSVHPVGWTGGAETVTLTEAQLPRHSHSGLYWGKELAERELSHDAGTACRQVISTGSAGGIVNNHYITGSVGGDQPHTNLQPSRAVCRWERVA